MALIHCPSPTQIYFLFPVSHGNVWLLSEKIKQFTEHTYIASESHFLLFIQACQCQIMTWNCLNIKQWYVLGEYDVDDDKQREIWNVEAGGRWYLSTAQRRSSIGPSQYRTSFCLTVGDLLCISVQLFLCTAFHCHPTNAKMLQHQINLGKAWK